METMLYHLVIDERWQTMLFARSDAYSYLLTYKYLEMEKYTDGTADVPHVLTPYPVDGDAKTWQNYISLLREHQWRWRTFKDRELFQKGKERNDMILFLKEKLHDQFVFDIFFGRRYGDGHDGITSYHC